MELTINKCPKCGSKDFLTFTTGRANCTLTYSLNEDGSSESNDGSSWDWDKINKKKEIRCTGCELSLERYVKVYED